VLHIRAVAEVGPSLNGVDVFLTTWDERAGAFGWTVEELFNLDPVAPLRRYDV
jgi:hypothetical protein